MVNYHTGRYNSKPAIGWIAGTEDPHCVPSVRLQTHPKSYVTQALRQKQQHTDEVRGLSPPLV